MATLAYVKWLDACYQDGDVDLRGEDFVHPGIELDCYGVLAHETPDSVTLALEVPEDDITRHVLTIPRQLILEMKTLDAEKIFKGKKSKVKAPTGVSSSARARKALAQLGI